MVATSRPARAREEQPDYYKVLAAVHAKPQLLEWLAPYKWEHWDAHQLAEVLDRWTRSSEVLTRDWLPIPNGAWLIPAGTGAATGITAYLATESRCQCPDYQRERKWCKHTMAVWRKLYW